MTSEVIDLPHPEAGSWAHGRQAARIETQGRGPTTHQRSLIMLTITPSPFLRQALVADATTSMACGLLMLLGAGPLTGILGLPAELLRASGLVLLPYALFVGYLGMRPHLQKPVIWAVV